MKRVKCCLSVRLRVRIVGRDDSARRYLAVYAHLGLTNRISTYNWICAPSSNRANCYHCDSCYPSSVSFADSFPLGGSHYSAPPNNSEGGTNKPSPPGGRCRRRRRMRGIAPPQTQIYHFAFCILHFGATHRQPQILESLCEIRISLVGEGLCSSRFGFYRMFG